MAAAVETVQRHAPTSECDGSPVSRVTFAPGTFDVIAHRQYRCGECDAPLCGCELAYGHDCE